MSERSDSAEVTDIRHAVGSVENDPTGGPEVPHFANKCLAQSIRISGQPSVL